MFILEFHLNKFQINIDLYPFIFYFILCYFLKNINRNQSYQSLENALYTGWKKKKKKLNLF